MVVDELEDVKPMQHAVALQQQQHQCKYRQMFVAPQH